MIARALALGVSLLMLTAFTAFAQDDYEEEEEEAYYEKASSTYMELLASYGHYELNGTDGGDEDTGGLGVIAGGHVSPWLAMEGQYGWLEDSNTHLASYALKLVPLHGRVQPFAKVGLGLMGGRPDHPFLFMGRFDLGTSFFLTEQLAVTATGTAALAKHHNQIFLGSLGLAYYFQ